MPIQKQRKIEITILMRLLLHITTYQSVIEKWYLAQRLSLYVLCE
jgi:hypothetical protein